MYFSFETMLQLFLYHRLYQPQKPVLPCELPFSQLYRGKGRLLLETGDAVQGEVALREALRWNPVDPEIVFELAEAFKLQKKLSAYLAKTRRAFDLAVTKEQLARCYRNWGYYFIEQKEYDNAAQLYFFSNGFAESEMVLHELLYQSNDRQRGAFTGSGTASGNFRSLPNSSGSLAPGSGYCFSLSRTKRSRRTKRAGRGMPSSGPGADGRYRNREKIKKKGCCLRSQNPLPVQQPFFFLW